MRPTSMLPQNLRPPALGLGGRVLVDPRQPVQHLAALRHVRIAFIAGPQHLKSASARREAFEASMKEIGLSPDLIMVGDHRMEGGMNGLLELNRLNDPPTAVLCSNDMTAIGALREAYEQNIKIPRRPLGRWFR